VAGAAGGPQRSGRCAGYSYGFNAHACDFLELRCTGARVRSTPGLRAVRPAESSG